MVAVIAVILALTGAPARAQFDVTSYGAVADCSTDNATAFQNALNAAAANTNGATVFIPAASSSTGCYVIKSPLTVQGHRITITGQGLHNPNLRFDLGSYAGTLSKYGFIVGETTTSTIAAAAHYDSTRIENLRMELKSVGSTGGGILVQRNPFFYLRSVAILSAAVQGSSTVPAYGVRVIGSDSQVVLDQVLIGSGGCATETQPNTAPVVAVSVEDGSNQTLIHDSTLIGTGTSVHVANSVGVWIERNELAQCASTNATLYGVNIDTGQSVPSWLTWIPNGTASDIHVNENIFEPGEVSPETIYDVYVGSGSPTYHSVVGTVIRDNTHLGTTQSTRKLYTMDYADQTFLNNTHWYGIVDTIATITSHATLTTVDLPDLTAYNTSGTPTIISDAGTKSVLVGRYMTPAYASSDFTPSGWTVDAGDIATYEYTVHHKRMHVIVYLLATSVTGSPHALYVKIPGGFTAAKPALAMARVVDNFALPAAVAVVSGGGTVISVIRSDSAAFATTTNVTDVQFELDFEVQ